MLLVLNQCVSKAKYLEVLTTIENGEKQQVKLVKKLETAKSTKKTLSDSANKIIIK